MNRRRRRSEKQRERGQILVMFALMLVVLLGLVGLVLDVGNFLHERQDVQNLVDSAALAGAQDLPDDGTEALNKANEYAATNDAQVTPGVGFRCITGDRDNNGLPDAVDLSVVCNAGANGIYNCVNGRCYAKCFPNEGDKCNTIVVSAEKNVPFYIAPVLSLMGGGNQCFFDECSTGPVLAAACVGTCGGPPIEPLDVVMILDRTGSMGDAANCGLPGNETELDCAKEAARQVLQVFNTGAQHVALGVTGPSDMSSACGSPNSGGRGIATNLSDPDRSWLPVPLSSDYKVGAALNSNSQIVKTINCLTTSSVGTDLASPTDAAKDYLANPANGRAGVKKAIMLFTDGAANQPLGSPGSPGTAGDTGWRDCGAQAFEANPNNGDGNGFERVSASAPLNSPGPINPANLCSDNDRDAQDVDSGTGTSTSCTSTAKDRHRTYNYGIAVTSGYTIEGIEVQLEDAQVSNSTGTDRMCVQLSWNGGATWTTAQQTGSEITTTETDFTLGNSTDNWGRTWSTNDFTNANFRVRVTNVSDNNLDDFEIDSVRVRVNYRSPGTPGTPDTPCQDAYDESVAAKAAMTPEIEIFTLGYGLTGEDCITDEAPSTYVNVPVTQTLADMATNSIDETGCDTVAEANQENLDGDHFLCAADASQLSTIFTAAAEALAKGSRLVRIPSGF